jgi:hypothetical protein
MLRAALLHLVAGAAIGALMLSAKGIRALAGALALLPAHQELLLVGWMVQLVLGVGFWILPRLPGRAREADARSAALVALLLNLGVLAAAVGDVATWNAITVAGRAAELLAVLLFLRIAWPRVRRYGMAV